MRVLQTSGWVAHLCGRRRCIRVPHEIESSHVLIMGDSGTGKSAIIRQILRQLDDRGDTAIVYDPALEYTPQFYDPARGDARVRDAHEASVDVALDELERYVQARLGGNRPAETTGTWVAPKFEHDSARPVNGYAAPQLHTHVVVFNLTHTVEADPPAAAAGIVQDAAVCDGGVPVGARHEAHRPGLRDRTRQKWSAGNHGVQHEYVEASSPRRKQIEDHLAKEQQQGAAAVQIAAHQTREAKLDLSHDEVQHQHRAMAGAFGDQPARVVRAAQERMHGVERDAPQMSAHAAVAFAKDRNLEREAVVDERAVVPDADAVHWRGVGCGQRVASSVSGEVSRLNGREKLGGELGIAVLIS
jgi:hypothetical protein